MKRIKVGPNTFEQRIYFCRQVWPSRKITYNVGLCWRPLNPDWKGYDHDELPPTADGGHAGKIFPGRERKRALAYAEDLSQKYGFAIDMSWCYAPEHSGPGAKSQNN